MRILSQRSQQLVVTALFATSVALFLMFRVDLERDRRSFDRILETDEQLDFPPGDFVNAAALNYRTAAADILWIALVIQFGETLRERYTLPENLIDNAHVIAEVDPYFAELYNWAPAAYLNRRGVVTEEDIYTANSIVDVGLKAFPNDSEMAYSAALNFIGFSRGASPERRLREIERGIEYLEMAIARPGADPGYESTLGWFQRRRRQLERQLAGEEFSAEEQREQEIELLTMLLERVTNPDLREALLHSLTVRGGTESDVVRRMREVGRNTSKAHQADVHWIPRDLWLMVSPTARAVDE